jgi:hypothetical protein
MRCFGFREQYLAHEMTAFDHAATVLEAFRSYLRSIDSDLVAEFVAAVDWQMPPRHLMPRRLSCFRHLDRAAEIAGPAEKPLIMLVAAHREALSWGQTYTADDFGERFLDNYGWVELFGKRGHFANDNVAAGLLVLGPDVLYPDHRHVAEELYVPLTGGTQWRKGEGGFVERAAGEVIHHPSNVSHAMRTGAEPLIALYLWCGGPLAQKSEITGVLGRTQLASPTLGQ